jgi:hypothetical protein
MRPGFFVGCNCSTLKLISLRRANIEFAPTAALITSVCVSHTAPFQHPIRSRRFLQELLRLEDQHTMHRGSRWQHDAHECSNRAKLLRSVAPPYRLQPRAARVCRHHRTGCARPCGELWGWDRTASASMVRRNVRPQNDRAHQRNRPSLSAAHARGRAANHQPTNASVSSQAGACEPREYRARELPFVPPTQRHHSRPRSAIRWRDHK